MARVRAAAPPGYPPLGTHCVVAPPPSLLHLLTHLLTVLLSYCLTVSLTHSMPETEWLNDCQLTHSLTHSQKAQRRILQKIYNQSNNGNEKKQNQDKKKKIPETIKQVHNWYVYRLTGDNTITLYCVQYTGIQWRVICPCGIIFGRYCDLITLIWLFRGLWNALLGRLSYISFFD
jgi:hypothetical protein